MSDDWNRMKAKAAAETRKLEQFDEWLLKQKHPFSRRAVGKYSRFKLNALRSAGIKFVEILGRNTTDDCRACLSLKGRLVPIEEAPVLPLPGCDKKHCHCLWLARK
jgi:hypothetical protein